MTDIYVCSSKELENQTEQMLPTGGPGRVGAEWVLRGSGHHWGHLLSCRCSACKRGRHGPHPLLLGLPRLHSGNLTRSDHKPPEPKPILRGLRPELQFLISLRPAQLLTLL